MSDMNDTITDTTALETTVDTWLAAYCEPDADHRAALIAAGVGADGELLDPPLAGSGHETLAALAGAVLGAYPGHTFRRTTPIDSHHSYAHYQWELLAPDGTVAVAGLDVAELTHDGRLQKVVGFFS